MCSYITELLIDFSGMLEHETKTYTCGRSTVAMISWLASEIAIAMAYYDLSDSDECDVDNWWDREQIHTCLPTPTNILYL